jgi:hypothetical protein
MRRPSYWLLIFLIIVLLPVITSDPVGANHVPASRITRSYYIASSSAAKMVNLGCANGDKQGRLTLFFGAPTPVGSSYGTTLWGAPNLSAAQVGNLTKEFIRGYAFCRRSTSYRLLIGVGTSNSTINTRSAAWVRGHGKTWATMVNQLAAFANRYYPGYVQVYGAWDAEPSWSTFTMAESWMQGYDNLYPARRALHANFSADGCPTQSATNGPCNNGWNQDRVWHLAWAHRPSLPFPQIYATSGVNARQWQLIDEWATHNRRDGMLFHGVMTQSGACAQVGGCAGTNNAPHRAYDFMIWYLASHVHTRQSSPISMTDIRWHS